MIRRYSWCVLLSRVNDRLDRGPLMLQVPGEVARHLGPGAEPSGDGPAWWVEARAAAGVPPAEQLAGACGPSDHAAGRPGLAAGRPGTVVAARPVDVSGITAVPAPAAAQPAVDMLTETAAVVLQDRPVVPMTSWLSEALRATVESDRSLQIVTPPHCRPASVSSSSPSAPCTVPRRTSFSAARWKPPGRR
ncbi:hypothetical protein BGK67_27800 [Streptomyces subrutilus]|uniref:Uncharacterized protein n=1 Tax=Streptomyces subrutilus TaxID=36818 RepID=A0A1E5PYQ3_9ACTN|nr:hypothetical protein BGK67_27800 [Streptomyces subrutilus]